jgi:16S rRNA (guanine527-N7)-methyltransferase
VAPLAVLVEYAAPLLRLGGTFIAWKAVPSDAEVAAGSFAAAEIGLEPLQPIPVQPYQGARALHLYLYSKVQETPQRFPRRPGIAAKRPLGA